LAERQKIPIWAFGDEGKKPALVQWSRRTEIRLNVSQSGLNVVEELFVTRRYVARVSRWFGSQPITTFFASSSQKK
jgi:hypothetical protein